MQNTAFSKRFSFVVRALVPVLVVTTFGQLMAYAAEGRSVVRPEGFEQHGFLSLKTAHIGLEVKVDDKLAGHTPLNLLRLPAGSHRLQVSHPDRTSWLENDWLSEFEIAGGDTLEVDVRFERSFSINSMPYGAGVLLDGEPAGETPLFFKLPERETRQVTLRIAGYRDSSFVVGDDATRFFNIDLLRSADQDLARKMDTFRVERKSKNNKRFLAVLGLTAAAGSLALLFRNKADNSYDRYLNTGEPARFSKEYDDAKKFDKLAAASFATFQVSFVVSFYFFLRRADQ